MVSFFEEALANPVNSNAMEVLRRTYPSIFNQAAYQGGGPYPQAELLPLLYANRQVNTGIGDSTMPQNGQNASGGMSGATATVGQHGANVNDTGIGAIGTAAADTNIGVSQAATVGNVMSALGNMAAVGLLGPAGVVRLGRSAVNNEVDPATQAAAIAAINPNPDPSLDPGMAGLGISDPGANAAAAATGNASETGVGSDASNGGPLRRGGLVALAGGGYLDGADGGMDDSVPASINGLAGAALSHGEYVIPADVVSALGDGNSKAGASKLEGLIALIREKKTGKTSQPKALGPMSGLLGAARMV